MRWFSRAAATDPETVAALAEARAHAEQWRQIAVQQQEMYRELVHELLALKRENFATPAAVPTMPSEPALPEVVELALREMEAGLPKDVQRAQRQKAIALLGTEKTPQQVAEIVRRGQNALRPVA